MGDECAVIYSMCVDAFKAIETLQRAAGNAISGLKDEVNAAKAEKMQWVDQATKLQDELRAAQERIAEQMLQIRQADKRGDDEIRKRHAAEAERDTYAELAGGKCVIQKVIDELGPQSLIATKTLKQLKEKLAECEKAVVAMAEDGWLSYGPEGMSEAQEQCYKAYLLVKPDAAIDSAKDKANG